MFDHTETACVFAGVAAIAAVYCSTQKNRLFYHPRPTECSARVVDSSEHVGTSAKVAGVDTSTNSDSVWTNEEGEDIMSMNTEASEAMKMNAPKLPAGGIASKQTAKNMESVKAQLPMETTYSKSLGPSILIAGRCGQETTNKRRAAVTGDCMQFYMSNAYADELMDRQKNKA